MSGIKHLKDRWQAIEDFKKLVRTCYQVIFITFLHQSNLYSYFLMCEKYFLFLDIIVIISKISLFMSLSLTRDINNLSAVGQSICVHPIVKPIFVGHGPIICHRNTPQEL